MAKQKSVPVPSADFGQPDSLPGFSESVPPQVPQPETADESPFSVTSNEPPEEHPRFKDVYRRMKGAEEELAQAKARLASLEGTTGAPPVTAAADIKKELAELKAALMQGVNVKQQVQEALYEQRLREEDVRIRQKTLTELTDKYPDLKDTSSALYRTAKAILDERPSLRKMPDGPYFAVAAAIGRITEMAAPGRPNPKDAILGGASRDIEVAGGKVDPISILERAHKTRSIDDYAAFLTAADVIKDRR